MIFSNGYVVQKSAKETTKFITKKKKRSQFHKYIFKKKKNDQIKILKILSKIIKKI